MNENSGQLEQARSKNQNTIAVVAGEAVQELPTDLYIPPAALEVFLETFEGPLDLLLYLIRRQNLDILNIKVAAVTAQYMRYIDLMQALQLELAGEYLLMAAMLTEIKSRMLLPRPDVADVEDDPRAELIRRLQEYEQIKTAAENIGEIPRLERDTYLAAASKPDTVRQHAEPKVDMKEVLVALASVLRRAEMFASHEIRLEHLSVSERMGDILAIVNGVSEFVNFYELFKNQEGRMGVVVTFLAVMELVREALIEFVQAEPYAAIHVRAVAAAVTHAPTFNTRYGGEPSAPGKEPSAEIKEPSAQGKEPSAQGKEPSAQGKEPSAQGKEPSAQGKEPSAQGKEPSAEIKEPSAKQDEQPSAGES